MAEHRGRIGSVLLLGCTSLCIHGCFYAYYPDTYDASDFEEFKLYYEIDPPCLDEQAFPRICEATITREGDGAYRVVLEGRTDNQPEPYRVERAMAESEVEDMIALFSELYINLHPSPFCKFPLMGGGNPNISVSGEAFFRWDDFELVNNDCDRERLDFHQGGHIIGFLRTLLPEDETVETP
ncbi:hypothetical protein KKH27_00530 [bacterium]|nr:hypothetical protein [bacterium]